MTIEIQNIKYEFRQFLFDTPKTGKLFPSESFAVEFLTKWISGGKEFLIETSGTTGVKKEIRLKRKWLEISALQTIQILNLWDEKIYCCVPSYKIGGMMMLVRALAGGFEVKIGEPKSDPMTELTLNHDFTFISLVPYQLTQIISNPVSLGKLSRFKTILLGGSDINKELLQKIQTLPPFFYHTFGMTETCSHIALKKLNHDAWPHFKLNPDIEIMTNEEGLLSVKAIQTGNEWVHTSDIIELFADKNFDFLGRADFVINTGGFKVFPELLETKIKKILISKNIPIDVLITSRPHIDWGEEIILVTKSLLSLSETDILSILKPFVEKFELPKRVIKMDEFPINESGKTDRMALKGLI